MDANETQVEDEFEPNSAPAETAPHARRHARASWIWFAAGIVAFASAGAWMFAPPNEFLDALLRFGARPVYGVVAGAMFVAVGFALRERAELATRAHEITDSILQIRQSLQLVHDDTARDRENALTAEQCSEIVARQVRQGARDASPETKNVADALEQVRAIVDAVRLKMDEASHARLTLAGSLDGLNARLERLQREVRAPHSQKISVADDIAPIARVVEGLERDEQSRAARQLDAIQGVHDALAEMEGRMRDRIDTALAELEERMHASIGASASAAPAAAPPSALSFMNVTVAEQGEPRRAAGDETSGEQHSPDGNVEITEGPRQSKTVLRAIDKLRSLRGM